MGPFSLASCGFHSVLILTFSQFSWFDNRLHSTLKGRSPMHWAQASFLSLWHLAYSLAQCRGPINVCTTNGTLSTYCMSGSRPGAGIINFGMALHDSQSSSGSH